MRTSVRLLALGVALTGAVACAEEQPLSPEPSATIAAAPGRPAIAEYNRALATLRGATARYHELQAALDDGFVFLHPCEERPGEGPVGTVYVHIGRLSDGRIDPALPDALVYEPNEDGARLVAAELATPMVEGGTPPQFLGHTFQPEEEFGAWALHVWLWRSNPEGMFAEANPNVTC